VHLRRVRWTVVGILSVMMSAVTLAGQPATTTATAADVRGYWRGQLKTPVAALTIGLTISSGSDSSGGGGALTATLDSPDQGAMDIPVASVTLTGRVLRAEVRRIGGVYEATLRDDGQALVGEWRQGAATLPLTLERRDPSERKPSPRPQDPKPPYPYTQEEVSYQNAKAGITLAGTLTMPKASTSPAPAVLLLSGSGAQDRDEALMGHRPFLVLADHLTRQGIAVLRVDDRGVGGSTGKYTTSTLFDLADDAVVGVEFLKTRPGIDPARIGIIGHSEGGMVAPLAATKNNSVRFLVLMAGSGMTGEEILYAQGVLIARAQNAPEEAITRRRTFQERSFAVLKQEQDAAAADVKLRAVVAESFPNAGAAEKAALEASLGVMNQPWFRAMLTYDPKPTLRKVTVPVLAIVGEKDVQVPPKENLALIEEALAAGGNKQVTIQMLPGLNHLFQTATTGAPSEYAQITETMAPAALQAVSDWIRARTAR
jgi:pimeloyl-ACP methyl ester carboxylesterase